MFGSGGGRREAAALGVPLLAEIPLVPEVRACMDRGEPIVVAEPEGVVAVIFGRLAAVTLDALEATADAPES
jgi:ATP-binding protein involved in chromosome partitioning